MDTIRELIAQLQEKAEKAKDAKLSGTWKGWFIAFGVGLLISIGIIIVTMQLRRRSAELAKARTDLEQQEATLKNLEYQRSVAVHEQEIKALDTEASILKLRVKDERARIVEQQLETDSAIADALKVRDWSTLDMRNQEGR